ncbi:MAG: hypothetical protein VX730_05570 [Pseudomonadota bacterium]|nr:hypothetical protein [Pseudomonadota bacterium]
MSNDTVNNIASKGRKWLGRASLVFGLLAVIAFGLWSGFAQRAYFGVTTFASGVHIATVTDTGKLTAYDFVPCVETNNHKCSLTDRIIGERKLVEQKSVSVTWADGNNEVLYNTDSVQFYKPDSNTVEGDANALQRQGSRGENDKAVVIKTGLRLAVFNRFLEGGINSNIIRLHEYIADPAVYEALDDDRKANVITGDVGYFSFPTLVWNGIGIGVICLIQLICMYVPFAQFGLRRKVNWSWMLGPVGWAVYGVGKWGWKKFGSGKASAT